jgi:hypothetical protein
VFPLGRQIVWVGCWTQSGGGRFLFERKAQPTRPSGNRLPRHATNCGDELLVSLVCATGATDDVKCVAPGAAARSGSRRAGGSGSQ